MTPTICNQKEPAVIAICQFYCHGGKGPFTFVMVVPLSPNLFPLIAIH